MLHKETVEPVLLNLLQRLFSFEELKGYVLVGGTALSLRIGNRKSIDIDLFTQDSFDGEKILDFLRNEGFHFEVQSRSKGAVLGHINKIKVDFIRHNYPWIMPVERIEGIMMASLEDIAAMKLNAIVGSGSRLKDFVDVAFLSGYMSLSDMLNYYEQKYPDINGLIALKSLCYFDDIDFSVEIQYAHKPLRWEVIQQRIMQMVQNPDKVYEKMQEIN